MPGPERRAPVQRTESSGSDKGCRVERPFSSEVFEFHPASMKLQSNRSEFATAEACLSDLEERRDNIPGVKHTCYRTDSGPFSDRFPASTKRSVEMYLVFEGANHAMLERFLEVLPVPLVLRCSTFPFLQIEATFHPSQKAADIFRFCRLFLTTALKIASPRVSLSLENRAPLLESNAMPIAELVVKNPIVSFELLPPAAPLQKPASPVVQTPALKPAPAPAKPSGQAPAPARPGQKKKPAAKPASPAVSCPSLTVKPLSGNPDTVTLILLPQGKLREKREATVPIWDPNATGAAVVAGFSLNGPKIFVVSADAMRVEILDAKRPIRELMQRGQLRVRPPIPCGGGKLWTVVVAFSVDPLAVTGEVVEVPLPNRILVNDAVLATVRDWIGHAVQDVKIRLRTKNATPPFPIDVVDCVYAIVPEGWKP